MEGCKLSSLNMWHAQRLYIVQRLLPPVILCLALLISNIKKRTIYVEREKENYTVQHIRRRFIMFKFVG